MWQREEIQKVLPRLCADVKQGLVMANVGNLGTFTTFKCGLRIVGIRSAVMAGRACYTVAKPQELFVLKHLSGYAYR